MSSSLNPNQLTTNPAGSLQSTLQKPKKEVSQRKSATFNIGSLKKLNQDLLLKLERQKVQQELSNVKKGTSSVLDDIPMMTFDEDPLARGWKSIYLGLYSPFQNKYTSFMKHAIDKAKENNQQNSAVSHPSPSKLSGGGSFRFNRNGDNISSGIGGSFFGSHILPAQNFDTNLQNGSSAQNSDQKKSSSLQRKQQFSKGSKSGGAFSSSDEVSAKANSGHQNTNQPPSRSHQEGGTQEMSTQQWLEQQEMSYIIMFESLSRHKRNLIEEQIRSGNLNLMAQKYFELVSQKKIRRTLKEVFQVQSQPQIKINTQNLKPHQNSNTTTNAMNSRRHSSVRGAQNVNFNILKQANLKQQNMRKSYKAQESEEPQFLQDLELQLNFDNKMRNMSIKYPQDLINQAQASQLSPRQANAALSAKQARCKSAMAKIDATYKVITSSIVLNKKFENQNQIQIDDLFQREKKREIIRRKSCECSQCGGETVIVPMASLYEEEESFENEQEEKETYSTGITIKFPVTSPPKHKVVNIFRNLKQAIAKSPSNRGQQLKNSKTQPNLNFESGFLTAHTFKQTHGAKNDFFDKEKIINKYKGNKILGGLSPIQDIERKVKKNIEMKEMRILNQKTQKGGMHSNQIHLFNPDGLVKNGTMMPSRNRQDHYKKLITIDSANEAIQSPVKSYDSEEHESPVSFIQIAEKRQTPGDKFLKFMTLDSSKPNNRLQLSVPQETKCINLRKAEFTEPIEEFDDNDRVFHYGKKQNQDLANDLGYKSMSTLKQSNLLSVNQNHLSTKSRNLAGSKVRFENFTEEPKSANTQTFYRNFENSLNQRTSQQEPSKVSANSNQKLSFIQNIAQKQTIKYFHRLNPSNSELKFSVLKKEMDDFRHRTLRTEKCDLRNDSKLESTQKDSNQDQDLLPDINSSKLRGSSLQEKLRKGLNKKSRLQKPSSTSNILLLNSLSRGQHLEERKESKMGSEKIKMSKDNQQASFQKVYHQSLVRIIK